MDIVPMHPLRAASLSWSPRPGAFALTVVCKATFQLLPVQAQLAADQDPVNEEDNHWDDNAERSLYSPADLVPMKPRADVILVGNAFAPRKEPVQMLRVRMLIGDIDKSIEVFADRWFTLDGQLREGARFVKMALRYERAAGGLGTGNPVGVRLDGPADARGNRALPNLQPPGLFISRMGEVIPTIGFGPIAPSWSERRGKLGRHAAAWPFPGWAEQAFPEDIDPGFFNVAPRDQQASAIRDNERIILENLHPEHPRLVTSLPGVRPRAVVERRTGAEEIALRADTLWIDTDRWICTVTWRGQVRVEHPTEAGRVLISLESGAPRRAPSPSRPDGEEGAGAAEDAVMTMVPLPRQGPVMPFVAGRPEASPMSRPQAAEEVEAESVDLSPEDLQEERDEAGGTMMLLPREQAGQAGQAAQPLPFVASLGKPVAPTEPFFVAPKVGPPPQVAPVAPVAPSQVMPPAVVPPPPVVRSPVTLDPIGPQVKASPWAGAEARAGGQTVGESAAQQMASANVMTGAVSAPSAAVGGAVAASNAAAAAAGEVPKRGEGKEVEAKPIKAAEAPAKGQAGAGEIVKLIWFEPKSVARIRKHEEWRVVLAELELRLLDQGEEEEEGAPEGAGEGGAQGPNPKDRRDVFEVLMKGAVSGADGVRRAVAGAVGKDGRFTAPLVLVAGELEFPFDELETLKATATAVRPFASGDKKLKEALETVDELLKTPWVSGSGGLADGLTEKVREAFAQGRRGLPADYLESHTERMLLSERCYQRRTVFGKKWIRALLKGGGGGGSGSGAGDVPVYVPEELKEELPLFRRVRVRMIGEAELREDQYEACPAAVKVVALGRVVAGVG